MYLCVIYIKSLRHNKLSNNIGILMVIFALGIMDKMRWKIVEFNIVESGGGM